MSSPNRTNAANGNTPAGGMSQDDVYFTLFRHKWLILGFCCLGVIGAVTVRVIRPPLYMSQAKLMVQNVATLTVKPAGDEQHIQSIDQGAQSTIAAEVDILTSGDVAARAAAEVGPAKILAKKGGGNDLQSAAGVIGGGLTVEPPRTAVITVTFKHPDRSVVQPVLAAVLTSYQRKHVEVHLGDQAREENLSQQMEEIRGKLVKTDEDLKAACGNGTFASFFASGSLQEQIVKAQAELWEAKKDLAERTAMYPEAEKASASPGTTNEIATMPDAETIEEYTQTVESLRTFKKRQREYEDQGLKESHPTVAAIIERVQKLTSQKAKLERQSPGLAQFATSPAHGSTNDPAASALLAAIEIKGLKAKVTALEGFLLPIIEAQPKIAKLLSLRAEQQKTYDSKVRSLDAIRSAKTDVSRSVADMSLVDAPSAPKIDYKKFMKLIGIALGGCIGFGFGLAFLIDMVLDRTIRRSNDVEKYLHLPVFLSIADTGWTPKFAWPWQKRGSANGTSKSSDDDDAETETALAPWKAGNDLQAHTEGLRERLLTYFEVNNLNLKKPKLVALTGCGTGSGVTTLASGLAAALSKTGDGNVLLVDMNSEHGIAHSFSNGKPGCGLSDVIEPEGRAEALVQENLYLARIDDRGEDNMAPVTSTRFNSLVPKLKASNYDYIIFDMPPVSPTSITPRMASHMDIVLLVLESEKTGQHRAAKASNLMRESRANVAAVLNKCRQHVPARLSQEL
jgi:uncharacterized protein involved in exopolysaccharide biosynthesis/Mrp family chromosome partitioning ATPase